MLDQISDLPVGIVIFNKYAEQNDRKSDITINRGGFEGGAWRSPSPWNFLYYYFYYKFISNKQILEFQNYII